MQEIKYERYLKLADRNLSEAIRIRARNIYGAKIYETDNYMIYTIGVDSEDGHLNGALCFNDDYSEEMLEKAEEFFKPLGFSYSVWVRDHSDKKLEEMLKSKGLEPKRLPGSAGMIIKNRIENVELPSGFELKEVKTDKEIEDLKTVTKNAFDKTDEVINTMFSSKSILINENVKSFVIYKDEEPLASAITVSSGDVSGIYWVGTVEKARGRGLGSHIVQISTNAGFDMGGKAVILQASQVGERVYNKLGYENITLYRSYLVK